MAKAINEGAGGFHMFTVVTDGYGHFIAEDTNGRELARVDSTGEEAASALMDLTALFRATLLAQDPDGETGRIQ